ncbi:MAG: hypothetical protein LBQ34_07305 [Alphaproteobacteria bacterium]|jgi:amino acid transporter|nr:hypothetical protein [Alphaproteobacteria bacterium]
MTEENQIYSNTSSPTIVEGEDIIKGVILFFLRLPIYPFFLIRTLFRKNNIQVFIYIPLAICIGLMFKYFGKTIVVDMLFSSFIVSTSFYVLVFILAMSCVFIREHNYESLSSSATKVNKNLEKDMVPDNEIICLMLKKIKFFGISIIVLIIIYLLVQYIRNKVLFLENEAIDYSSVANIKELELHSIENNSAVLVLILTVIAYIFVGKYWNAGNKEDKNKDDNPIY